MDFKKFNRTADPMDIERLRDYRKDLRAIKLEIYTTTNDMRVVGATQTLINKKKDLFNKEIYVNNQISQLMKKYDCN